MHANIHDDVDYPLKRPRDFKEPTRQRESESDNCNMTPFVRNNQPNKTKNKKKTIILFAIRSAKWTDFS